MESPTSNRVLHFAKKWSKILCQYTNNAPSGALKYFMKRSMYPSITVRRAALAHAEDALRRGQEITIRPSARSMEPLIHEGHWVTLRPLGAHQVEAGDIVLARVQRWRPLLKYLQLKMAST